MALRRILVPLFGADQPGSDHPDRPALHAALTVARLFGAHVDALYRPFRLDSDDHLRRLPPAYLEGYYRQLEEVSRAHGEQRDAAARRLFDEALARAGIPYQEEPAAPGQPSAAWRAVEEPVPEAVAHHGGVADLVVVGRPAGGAEEIEQATVEAALFGSACPVLLAPPAGSGGGAARLGERVLIGWNRSLPAERAVAGARPFLERAGEVVVFGVATGARKGPSPEEVARHLAWHGVRARVREVAPDHRAVGQVLLEEAREAGADLLVMGAYSHSRLRGALLGGVTRHVLAQAELPVLMAH